MTPTASTKSRFSTPLPFTAAHVTYPPDNARGEWQLIVSFRKRGDDLSGRGWGRWRGCASGCGHWAFTGPDATGVARRGNMWGLGRGGPGTVRAHVHGVATVGRLGVQVIRSASYRAWPSHSENAPQQLTADGPTVHLWLASVATGAPYQNPPGHASTSTGCEQPAAT